MINVVNINSSSFDIYIGRGTIWGNPYRIGIDGNRGEVLKKYRRYILNNPNLLNQLNTLDNSKLGCHCKPKNCHGDILVSLRDEQLRLF